MEDYCERDEDEDKILHYAIVVDGTDLNLLVHSIRTTLVASFFGLEDAL